MSSTVIRKTGELAGTRACRWWAGIVTLVGALLSSTPLRAQITLDGSLGPRQTLTGPNFTIGADIGQIRGHNLFHSFGQFNIPTLGSATFTGPAYIGNILSRVTGGSPSWIDGLLKSDIHGANFFLLNPSGVMFGPHATLNVSGSFHVSSADFIRLADGGVFHANLGKQSVLTVAEPAAFGFLNANPAAITVQESVLEVPEGRSLSLVGGNVSIAGGPSGLVRARSGRVSVISVASPGEVSFDAATQTPGITAGSFTRLGTIELSDQAFLSTTGNVDGPGSGTVAIRGGRLVMRDSDLRGNSNGDIDGARVGIDVRVTEEAILNNSRMLTGSFAGGRSGDIVVIAPVMTIENGGAVGTSTSASGRAGDVTVAVGRLTVTGGGLIVSSTAGSGEGGAVTIQATDSVSVTGSGPSGPSRLLSLTDSTAASGPITVSAPTVSLDSGAVVLSRTSRRASGNAGNILIDGDLSLSGRSSVSSISFGSGRAGDVTVSARESVSVAQLSEISSTVASRASGNPGRVLITTPVLHVDDDGMIGAQVSSTSSSAAAGPVELQAQTVSLTGGGAIVAGNSGDGGGTISITGLDPSQPADLVSLSGRGRLGPSEISNQTLGKGSAGRVSVFSRTLNVDGGAIVSNTFSGGDGGDIKLDVGSLTLTNGSFVGSGSGEQATGRGGTVTVAASDSVSLTSGAVVQALSLGSGDAGRISVSAPSLNMSGGAVITTLASAGGRAGGVAVDAGNLSMSGAKIDSTTFGAGSGGNVAITAREIDLRNGAVISANSQSIGDAGNISIIASGSFRSHNSTIATTALQGEGGNILLTAGRLVHLVGSQITASVQSGVGGGGNITIDPPIVILDHSRIQANAFGGAGGNVRIVADVFLKTDSVLSASSALGVSGVIDVQAPVTDVSGTLARLPEAIFQAAALLRAACQVRLAEGRTSSFVLAGRGGLAVEPGGLLGSPLLDEPVAASPAASPLSFSPVSFSPACR